MNKKLMHIFVFLFLGLFIISACDLTKERIAGNSQNVCRGSCIYYFETSSGAQTHYYEAPCGGNACGCEGLSPGGAPLQHNTCNIDIVGGGNGNDNGGNGEEEGGLNLGTNECAFNCGYINIEGNLEWFTHISPAEDNGHPGSWHGARFVDRNRDFMEMNAADGWQNPGHNGEGFRVTCFPLYERMMSPEDWLSFNRNPEYRELIQEHQEKSDFYIEWYDNIRENFLNDVDAAMDHYRNNGDAWRADWIGRFRGYFENPDARYVRNAIRLHFKYESTDVELAVHRDNIALGNGCRLF